MPQANLPASVDHGQSLRATGTTNSFVAPLFICMKVNKPILKLTNKDYNENGLSELLALYGSAYNVNIKIFNDLQHTITGWLGGKPNADDSNRPERASHFRKKY